jgi:hypothetical protein
MNCLECDDECWRCSDLSGNCTECAYSDDILYPDGTCDYPIEGCLQDPESYELIDGVYHCDLCDL